jgi:L-seryl-tRNA(Ser) seleniumtransferase
MPENIYEKWNVPAVINAVGYATRVGGSAPADDVVEAMKQAQYSFIEIDDLQCAASRCIAKHTGAQAGIVTCGAGAGLALAAAACLAGNNPDIMEALPDTSALEIKNIIYPQPRQFDYDHPIRVSGAKLDPLNYDAPNSLEEIQSAITDQTAAIGYVWKRMNQKPSVREVADLAHRHDLPLIIDAALSLPPTEHLKQFISDGADLVAISGGKHLGGPQASGLLFGKENLIRSAWVQMVDLDVRAATWSLRSWIDEGWIRRPPRHGIGRAMKVSKEAIVGVLTALENYSQRDHDAELDRWKKRVDELADGLSEIKNLDIKVLSPAPNGQPYPVIRIQLTVGLTKVL